MALIHDTPVRDAIAQLVKDRVDSGTLNASAQVVIFNASDQELVRLQMSYPAFGSPVGGTIDANAIGNALPTADGAAATFSVIDRDEQEVYRGSVSTASDADLTINDVNLVTSKYLEVTSFSYSAPQ